MSGMSKTDGWKRPDAYEAYMGRWSRPMAQAFLSSFPTDRPGRWMDVGCGTGALALAVLDVANPIEVVGVDPSADYIAAARSSTADSRVRFVVGGAAALPEISGSFDHVVAGLVLNHLPDPSAGLLEMTRVAGRGGTVGAYVWDYSQEMQMIRYFWEAAAEFDENSASVDARFINPICRPEPLRVEFERAGLRDVEVDAIDLPMVFPDFDDFWLPHELLGSSPTHRYVSGLDATRRTLIRERLRSTLPTAADGSISLIGRAWAARGTKATA